MGGLDGWSRGQHIVCIEGTSNVELEGIPVAEGKIEVAELDCVVEVADNAHCGCFCCLLEKLYVGVVGSTRTQVFEWIYLILALSIHRRVPVIVSRI